MKARDNDGVGYGQGGARPCTLSVVVPTRNEALNVGPLAVRLQAALSQTAGGWELIFVDDSDDTTPEMVERLADEVGVGSPVLLLHRPRGMRSGGLGGAISDGFAIARGRVVAVMDADLQHPPEVLPALIAPVLSGEVDLVAGSRYGWVGVDAGLSSPWRHLVSGGCRWLVHLLVADSRPLQDPLSGLFALRRSLLDGVELRPAGYKILLEVSVRARPVAVGNVGFNFGPATPVSRRRACARAWSSSATWLGLSRRAGADLPFGRGGRLPLRQAAWISAGNSFWSRSKSASRCLLPCPGVVEGQDGTPEDSAAGGGDSGPGAPGPHALIGGLDNLLASAEGAVLWLLRGAGEAVIWPIDKWITLRSEIRSWDQEGGGFVEEFDEPAPGAPHDRAWVAYWRRPLAGPVTALVVLMAVYIGVFGDLTYQQQSNYGTFGFDMGIYDQAIWLLAHFKTPFDTIRGLNYFGQHVNIVTLLFVPAYWFGAGPHFLFAIETVWMAAGAVPIWLLGRDKLHNSWIPLGLSAAYLLYPSVEWVNEWMFHPDALIITPLMFAYWLATRRRWGWFWFATALALSCKEDAGLAVLALGIVLWLKMRQRAMGLITTVAGAAWFLICTRLIIPLANGGGQPFYVALFPSSYGTTVFQIIDTLLFHPTRWVPTLVSATNLTYYAKLLWPVGMVALLEPAVLLIGVPQLLVNTLSTEGYTNNIQYYYTSIVVAAIFLATVEACGRQGRTLSGRRLMVAFVFAAAAGQQRGLVAFAHQRQVPLGGVGWSRTEGPVRQRGNCHSAKERIGFSHLRHRQPHDAQGAGLRVPHTVGDLQLGAAMCDTNFDPLRCH